MPSIRPHALELLLDDETWEALEARAAACSVSPVELVTLAVEQFLERDGFTPEWALTPLDVSFPVSPSSGSRRRAR